MALTSSSWASRQAVRRGSVDGMRVLIVEDEAKLAGIIRRGLQAHGWSADIAGDGDDAWCLATATRYDVIVLDVLLPGADGRAVCRRLRADGIDAPVLMLTALDAVRDRVAGLAR
jgi:two-component system, OmpR family, response regulator